MPELLLDVQNLKTQFKTPDGIIHAVNGVSLSMEEGETLGIVGESGCGKSVTMLSILRLIPMPPGKIVGGEAFFRGQDLLKMSEEDLQTCARRPDRHGFSRSHDFFKSRPADRCPNGENL